MAETTPLSSIGHLPGDKWAFDESVAKVFDDMLQRSIPAYASMRELTTDLAVAAARPHTRVVDVGCARGEAIAGMLGRVPADVRFLATDVSEPMLDACRRRFWGSSGLAPVDVVRHDLRAGFPTPARTASVVLAVLTLQFTPIEHRLRIVRDAWRALVPGGSLFLVEKIIGASAEIDAAFVARYYAHKLAMGYSQDEIDRKRLSLEGVLVPVTADWNEDMLRRAGFVAIDCYWRWLNFAGWVATKAEADYV